MLKFEDLSPAADLVTSRAFWTLAWTEPSRSAPIFFSSWVSRTNSQSCRSSLCSMMKSTRVSRNMLNTWERERGMKKRRRRRRRRRRERKGQKERIKSKFVHWCLFHWRAAEMWQDSWLWWVRWVNTYSLVFVRVHSEERGGMQQKKKHTLLVHPAVSSDVWAVNSVLWPAAAVNPNIYHLLSQLILIMRLLCRLLTCDGKFPSQELQLLRLICAAQKWYFQKKQLLLHVEEL